MGYTACARYLPKTKQDKIKKHSPKLAALHAYRRFIGNFQRLPHNETKKKKPKKKTSKVQGGVTTDPRAY